MKIAIASDHAGFALLGELKQLLTELGHSVIDFGPPGFNPKDDYPDFVVPAARSVASGESDRGIVIGGDGQGEAMAANRVIGVRCAVFYGPLSPRGTVEATSRTSHDPYEIIKLTRLHNNANMLSLGAWFISTVDLKQAVKLWLTTDFSHEPRHSRRNLKLDKEV